MVEESSNLRLRCLIPFEWIVHVVHLRRDYRIPIKTIYTNHTTHTAIPF
jgi:hypothetical protein